VSVGALYEYFANKEEVFDALIQRELESIVVAVQSRENNPTAPIGEKISQLLLANMRAMPFGPELFRIEVKGIAGHLIKS